ncbi:MAG TPA: RNase adapter RapZ [Clostridiaceae bacterium]|nr:RNase adapter RapZ [Clostridiaceae bacterium]
MELLIVTGLSGAGKSLTLDVLEDMNYYCIDNLPPQIMLNFTDFMSKHDAMQRKIAFGIDSRSQNMFSDFEQVLSDLDDRDIDYDILYLECSVDELRKRYKETRRIHPLMTTENLTFEAAIRLEEEYLVPIRARASYIIDTTYLKPSQLRSTLLKVLSLDSRESMVINIYSFGFKHGTVSDADLLFDMRCLPNPHYIDELRPLTGEDYEVSEYVMSFPEAIGMLEHILNLLEFAIPLYIAEGKAQLVIGIGCTGGRHRSVTFANYIASELMNKGYPVVLSHRDIDKQP